MQDRITEPGIVAPEILPRAVRDAFIAELGRRDLKVFRRFETQIA